MKTKKITLKNIEVLNIMDYLCSPEYCFSNEKIAKNNSKVSTKVSWIMLKNKKAISEIYQMIIDEKQKIDNKYSDDEHSHEEKNENGDVMRVVNDLYIDEYIKENKELYDLDNEITIDLIDIESLFDYQLTEADLNYLTFMIDDSEE